MQTLLKPFLLLLLACFLSLNAMAQTDGKRSASAVSFGFGGYNVVAGMNYDQLVLRRDRFNLGFRIGLSFYNMYTESYFFYRHGKGGSLGLNFLYGRRTAHLDCSVNFGLMHDHYVDDVTTAFHHGTAPFVGPAIAFRYQRPEGGLYLRAGISPIILFRVNPNKDPALFPSPLLEIGFSGTNSYQHPQVVKARVDRKERRARRVPYEKELLISIALGPEFPAFSPASDTWQGGQGGGTAAGLSDTTVRAALAPQLGVEWRIGKRIALASGFDLRREKMDFSWYTYSWDLIGGTGSSSSGNMDVDVLSLRVPFLAKLVFGNGPFECGPFLGPYLNFRLLYHETGDYRSVKNSIVSTGTIDNSDSHTFPYAQSGLIPAIARLGFLGGLEARYRIRESHRLFVRGQVGKDLTSQFSFPLRKMHWANLQAGYALTL